MTTTKLVSVLRSSTRNAHQGLDQHPLLAPLSRSDMNFEEYACSLSALHAAQSVAEARIASGLIDFGLSYAFHPRMSALEQDLADLKRAPMPLSVVDIPVAAEEAAVLGYLYVIEGSRLGARMLGRHIARVCPSAPVRFFDATGNPSAWAGFCAYAETHCPPARQFEAVQAAVTLFDFYRRHLDACWTDAQMA